jgi:hypothetical protein
MKNTESGSNLISCLIQRFHHDEKADYIWSRPGLPAGQQYPLAIMSPVSAESNRQSAASGRSVNPPHEKSGG